MLRTALTIAGLDPSGGAGIAIDLRAFAAAGAWGTAVCAALTVQSTRGVTAVHPVEASLVRAQALEVLGDADVRAIKTGALGSAANAREVLALAKAHEKAVFVVDPVMVASRAAAGSARLGGDALEATDALARAATLVTPNLPEASALLGRAIDANEARGAAIELQRRGARAALVKGGHGEGDLAIDWLATSSRVVAIEGPRRAARDVHGTGCALASLIAGKLAMLDWSGAPSDEDLEEAARWARATLDRALLEPWTTGHGQRVLGELRS